MPSNNSKYTEEFREQTVRHILETENRQQVWAGDITYIKTKVGWVYLAVVIDLFNREIIGYDFGKKIDSQPVKNALGNAIGRRGIKEGLIFHGCCSVAVGTGLISGRESVGESGNIIYDLSPQSGATRAQMATILQRFCEYYHI